MTTRYRAMTETPPLVERARAYAKRMGFEQSCLPEVGRLLAVFTGSVTQGAIGEIGTGTGVGAAWIASGLRPGVRFVTVEIDPDRAVAARELLREVPNVEVITGDWRLILNRGPFALLFADGGKAKAEEPRTLLEALAPGGTIVLDDLTPEDRWPEEWRGSPDPVRGFWLNDPRVIATEVRTTLNTAAILATRRS